MYGISFGFWHVSVAVLYPIDFLNGPMAHLLDLSVKMSVVPVVLGALAITVFRMTSLRALTLIIFFWSMIFTPWLMIDKIPFLETIVKDAGLYLAQPDDQGVVGVVSFAICLLSWAAFAMLRAIATSFWRWAVVRS